MIYIMSTNNKKAILTDENRAESARLKLIWDERKHLLNMTQADFGEEFGIGTQGAVSACLKGNMALSLKAAIGFAKGLKCNVADFSPRLADLAATVTQVAASLYSTAPAGPSIPTTLNQTRALYEVPKTTQWPFEMFSYDDWMSLPKKDRQDYEALIYGAVHRARKTRRNS